MVDSFCKILCDQKCYCEIEPTQRLKKNKFNVRFLHIGMMITTENNDFFFFFVFLSFLVFGLFRPLFVSLICHFVPSRTSDLRKERFSFHNDIRNESSFMRIYINARFYVRSKIDRKVENYEFCAVKLSI